MSSTILSPRYRFISFLGRGGFGSAYLMEDTLVNRNCIIKFIQKNTLNENEINIMKQIHSNGCHPNLICLRDYFVYKNWVAIISDYIEGNTLYKSIFDNKSFFVYNEFLWIFKKMIDSVNYLHNILNVAHLDIKPENIMLTIKSGEHNISIIDFGATCINNRSTSLCKVKSWTRGFVPPSFVDIANNNTQFSLEYGKSVDIFSLGITMFYVLFMSNPIFNLGRRRHTKDNILIQINGIINELKKDNNTFLINRFRTVYPHIQEDDSKNIIQMFSGYLIAMLNPDDSNRIKIDQLVLSVDNVIKANPTLNVEFQNNDNNVKKRLTTLNQIYTTNRQFARNASTLSEFTADRVQLLTDNLTKQIISEEYDDIITKAGIN